MKLLKFKSANLNWIKFQNLDLFMLQMRSGYLANLLDDFSSFGERVLRLIQEAPDLLFWDIGGQIVVERTRWRKFCEQMMTLLHVLGVAGPSSARPRLRPWPDRDLLEAAAARASGIFGRFARADTSTPSVRAPPSRHPHSAAAPRSREAKRRREDSEPPPGLPPRTGSPAGPDHLA
jgi:hypothetical protein